ncbi:MAG: hypothetical protein P4L71_04345 [Acetobacteraceae bacterium]|nr:hypothetical protein [Acetobacteraceae bacterium]
MRIPAWFTPAWIGTVLRLGIPAPAAPVLALTGMPRSVRRRGRWHAPSPPPESEPDPLDDEAMAFQLALICMACI